MNKKGLTDLFTISRFECNIVEKTKIDFWKNFLYFFSDIRLTKMMLTIFLCFLVCFLPLMLVNVADDNVQFPFLHILASVLAWASAVVNPFIYAFKNRQYQQAFIKVISFVKLIHTNTIFKIYFHIISSTCFCILPVIKWASAMLFFVKLIFFSTFISYFFLVKMIQFSK